MVGIDTYAMIVERSLDSLFYASTTVKDIAIEIRKEWGVQAKGRRRDGCADERFGVIARICCSGAGMENENPGRLEKFIRMPGSRVVSACEPLLIIQIFCANEFY